MHTANRFYVSNADIFSNPNNLQNKSFLLKIVELSEAKCIEYYGESLKNNKEKFKECKHNVGVAITCVELNKANTKVGDLRDHLGTCKYDIDLSNEKLISAFGSFPTTNYKEFLRNISLSTKSIV
jgi:hypothetical protein